MSSRSSESRTRNPNKPHRSRKVVAAVVGAALTSAALFGVAASRHEQSHDQQTHAFDYSKGNQNILNNPTIDLSSDIKVGTKRAVLSGSIEANPDTASVIDPQTGQARTLHDAGVPIGKDGKAHIVEAVVVEHLASDGQQNSKNYYAYFAGQNGSQFELRLDSGVSKQGEAFSADAGSILSSVEVQEQTITSQEGAFLYASSPTDPNANHAVGVAIQPSPAV